MRYKPDTSYHTYWAVLHPLTTDTDELTEILPMDSEEDADRKVASWANRGIPCLKVFRELGPWTVASRRIHQGKEWSWLNPE